MSLIATVHNVAHDLLLQPNELATSITELKKLVHNQHVEIFNQLQILAVEAVMEQENVERRILILELSNLFKDINKFYIKLLELQKCLLLANFDTIDKGYYGFRNCVEELSLIESSIQQQIYFLIKNQKSINSDMDDYIKTATINSILARQYFNLIRQEFLNRINTINQDLTDNDALLDQNKGGGLHELQNKKIMEDTLKHILSSKPKKLKKINVKALFNGVQRVDAIIPVLSRDSFRSSEIRAEYLSTLKTVIGNKHNAFIQMLESGFLEKILLPKISILRDYIIDCNKINIALMFRLERFQQKLQVANYLLECRRNASYLESIIDLDLISSAIRMVHDISKQSSKINECIADLKQYHKIWQHGLKDARYLKVALAKFNMNDDEKDKYIHEINSTVNKLDNVFKIYLKQTQKYLNHSKDMMNILLEQLSERVKEEYNSHQASNV